LSSKQRKGSSEDTEKPKMAGNPTDLSARGERRLGKIFGRGLGGHPKLLISQVRRKRPLGHKSELEVVDDSIDDGEVPLARASGVLKEPIRPR